VGYLSFTLPADITPSSISSAQLELNYKAARPTNQTWTILAYNWKTKKWVKIGNTTNMRNAKEWVSKAFTVANIQRYVSSGKEIRIQLLANNGSGDLKVDYEVIKITASPTATFTPTYTPSPTPAQ